MITVSPCLTHSILIALSAVPRRRVSVRVYGTDSDFLICLNCEASLVSLATKATQWKRLTSLPRPKSQRRFAPITFVPSDDEDLGNEEAGNEGLG